MKIKDYLEEVVGGSRYEVEIKKILQPNYVYVDNI